MKDFGKEEYEAEKNIIDQICIPPKSNFYDYYREEDAVRVLKFALETPVDHELSNQKEKTSYTEEMTDFLRREHAIIKGCEMIKLYLLFHGDMIRAGELEDARISNNYELISRYFLEMGKMFNLGFETVSKKIEEREENK